MPFDDIGKQVGTLQIMRYLYAHKEIEKGIPVTTIQKESRVNYNPMYKSLKLLIEHDLVEKEEVHGFPPRKYYWLTDKGSKLTELVIAGDELLKSDE